MAVANPIKDALKLVMERHGFRKDKPFFPKEKEYWIREWPEVNWFVGLQVSKYGKEYFVNLRLHLNGVAHPDGKERQLPHGVARLDTALATSEAIIEVRTLLNLRHEMDDQERKSRLIEIFERSMLPIFYGCETRDSARSIILAQRFFFPESPLTEAYLKRHKWSLPQIR